MSNETASEDKEMEELRQQIEQAAETNKEQAAPVETPEPSPASIPSPAPEAAETQATPVTPNESEAVVNNDKPKDDPMEWAKKKGFKTPEDMARALLQKEQEFHQSRQKADQANQPPPQPQWQPAPQMGYGYQQPQPNYQPMPRSDTYRDVAAMYPQLDPEDVKRVLPLIVDASQAIAARERAAMETRFGHIERTTQRNNELMGLMQDPAFRDNRVQKEVHSILDSDPSIFQRERTPLAYAYEKAMVSLARKQLQQGGSGDTHPSMGTTPPVTAGGGNGSANTSPMKITEKLFDSWSDVEQKAFIQSNGRTVPKR